MSAGFRGSQQAPFFPVAVRTSPAFESFARIRRRKLGLVFTLRASRVEVMSPSCGQPRAAIICTAIENWVLTATTVTLLVTESNAKIF